MSRSNTSSGSSHSLLDSLLESSKIQAEIPQSIEEFEKTVLRDNIDKEIDDLEGMIKKLQTEIKVMTQNANKPLSIDKYKITAKDVDYAPIDKVRRTFKILWEESNSATTSDVAELQPKPVQSSHAIDGTSTSETSNTQNSLNIEESITMSDQEISKTMRMTGNPTLKDLKRGLLMRIFGEEEEGTNASLAEGNASVTESNVMAENDDEDTEDTKTLDEIVVLSAVKSNSKINKTFLDKLKTDYVDITEPNTLETITNEVITPKETSPVETNPGQTIPEGMIDLEKSITISVTIKPPPDQLNPENSNDLQQDTIDDKKETSPNKLSLHNLSTTNKTDSPTENKAVKTITPANIDTNNENVNSFTVINPIPNTITETNNTNTDNFSVKTPFATNITENINVLKNNTNEGNKIDQDKNNSRRISIIELYYDKQNTDLLTDKQNITSYNVSSSKKIVNSTSASSNHKIFIAKYDIIQPKYTSSDQLKPNLLEELSRLEPCFDQPIHRIRTETGKAGTINPDSIQLLENKNSTVQPNKAKDNTNNVTHKESKHKPVQEPADLKQTSEIGTLQQTAETTQLLQNLILKPNENTNQNKSRKLKGNVSEHIPNPASNKMEILLSAENAAKDVASLSDINNSNLFEVSNSTKDPIIKESHENNLSTSTNVANDTVNNMPSNTTPVEIENKVILAENKSLDNLSFGSENEYESLAEDNESDNEESIPPMHISYNIMNTDTMNNGDNADEIFEDSEDFSTE